MRFSRRRGSGYDRCRWRGRILAGAEQTADGRWQTADDGRPKTEDRGPKTNDRRWKMEDQRQMRLPQGGDRGREDYSFTPQVRGWGGDRGWSAELQAFHRSLGAAAAASTGRRGACSPVTRRVRRVRKALVQRESVRTAGLRHEGHDQGLQVREPLRLSRWRHH